MPLPATTSDSPNKLTLATKCVTDAMALMQAAVHETTVYDDMYRLAGILRLMITLHAELKGAQK